MHLIAFLSPLTASGLALRLWLRDPGRSAKEGICISAPPVADVKPGPEAVAEGRTAGQGDCSSALLGNVEGRTAGLGVCFAAPLAADFEPGPEAASEAVAKWHAVGRGHGGCSLAGGERGAGVLELLL